MTGSIFSFLEEEGSKKLSKKDLAPNSSEFICLSKGVQSGLGGRSAVHSVDTAL